MSAAQQLAAEGLRLAAAHEPGWWVLVLIDGEPRRVWATQETDLDALRARADQLQNVNDSDAATAESRAEERAVHEAQGKVVP